MISRTSRKLWLLAAAMAVAAGMAIAGCGGNDDGGGGGSASGGGGDGASPLVVALRGNPVNLDPHTTTISEDTNVTNQIYDTLVGIDEELSPVPELAKSWEISDDGITYTFELEEGVTFHDGTPFDAEAVVFNIERVLSPEVTSPQKEYLEPVKSVKAIDDHTVQFKLKQPSASFLAVLSTQVGQLVSPAAVEKHGEDYGSNPVGTGPFTFKEWVADDRVVVDKNPDYWQEGLPKVDSIRFDIIPDSAVALTAVRTGDADIMVNVPQESRELAESADGVSVVEGSGLRTDVILFNSTKPPFDDVHLRRAVNYAIDREALVEGSLGGLGDPAFGMITPTQWAYGEGRDCFPYDPDAAKRELAAAGKADGFSFRGSATSVPDNLQSAEAIQAQLAEVGIDMEIVPVEITQAGEMLANADFEAARLWSAGRVDPAITYADFYLSQKARLGGPWTEKVFGLIDEADRETDRDARTDLYGDLEQEICDQAVDTYIYHPNITAAVRDRVTDFTLPPDERVKLKNVGLSD